MLRRLLQCIIPILALPFLMPVAALAGTNAAGTAVDDPVIGLPFWSLLAGAVVPIASYLINHYAPHTSERVKGLVHVVAAAVAGALTQLIDQGKVNFDLATGKYVLAAVGMALFAHNAFYAPSTINTKFGGGSDSPRSARRKR